MRKKLGLVLALAAVLGLGSLVPAAAAGSPLSPAAQSRRASRMRSRHARHHRRHHTRHHRRHHRRG